MLLLKFVFENAFNKMFREYLLNETRTIYPKLLPMLQQTYGQRTNLYYKEEVILSQRVVQQGDPVGSPGFCI